MIICGFEKSPLNSKLLRDKDCLHWIWPVKKMTPQFPKIPFHSCAPSIFISYFLVYSLVVLGEGGGGIRDDQIL
jgi:hypothetical protein